MELIEQNESCTETKRDRKAKGREENLMRGEEEGGASTGRVCRGETDTRRRRMRRRRHNHVHVYVLSSEEEAALCIKKPDEISSIRPL